MSSVPPPIDIAGHSARFDSAGHLTPWTSWLDALTREMNFYQQCPVDHGYPRFAHATFLDADWTPAADRLDAIPATQNGMAIISYLKFHAMVGGQDPRFVRTARLLGDYLVRETLTPAQGPYPMFTRSTGRRNEFPQPVDAGSQGDRPYEIEPDKGGVAGYALTLLFDATGESRYWEQALRNARALAANQTPGNAFGSPWPFRVDLRNGEPRGPISGNMSFVLRLFDAMLAHGYDEFAESRQALWDWIKLHQIVSARGDGALFAQFFEDHDSANNRTAWAPLNLTRYLLERKATVEADWLEDAGTLLDFVRANFTHAEFGITVCHEQDEDREPWGGVNSTFGAVLALFAKATESRALALEARQALNFTLYSIDGQGRPRDLYKNPVPGGWQEDAHTDVIHNYVDALRAFPEWSEQK